MKRKLIFLGLVIALIAIPLAACTQATPAPAPAPAAAPTIKVPAPAPAPVTVTASAPSPVTVTTKAPVVLRAVQMNPVGDRQFAAWEWFIKEVNRKSGGKLTIDVLGGPEVISTKDQSDAVADGLVDIGCIWTTRLAKLAPPLGFWGARHVTALEAQANGVWDIFRNELANDNIYWLGPAGDSVHDYAFVFTNRNATSPEDLAGLRVATGPGFINIVTALSLDAQMMSPGERYAAVERGVADGSVVSHYKAEADSFFEVLDYWIDHGVNAQSTSIAVNLDVWNNLPDDLKQIVTDAASAPEVTTDKIMGTVSASVKQTLMDGGMKPITFSDKVAASYVESIYDATWAIHYTKYPDWAPIMEPLVRK